MGAAYSVACGTAAQMHFKNENEDFDRWVQLDQRLCDVFKKVTREYTNMSLQFQFKEQNLIDEAYTFFDKNLFESGSTKENTAICRTLTAEKLDIEIDRSYRLASLDYNTAKQILVPTGKAGYFHVRTTILTHLLPFWKADTTLSALCPNRTECRMQDWLNITDNKSEFVDTTHLKVTVTAYFSKGYKRENHYLLHGPTSTDFTLINSYVDILVGFLRQFTTIKKFDPVSLDELIDTGDPRCIMDESTEEELLSLYKAAFPPNQNNIDIYYWKKFLQAFIYKHNTNTKNVIAEILELSKASGFLPHFQIKEPWKLYIDHVPCVYLDFWPHIASKWLNKKERHWPDKQTIERISTSGTFIVPKSTPLEKQTQKETYEWRISFSGAEVILSESFTPFQRKCYLVAKCIYYTTIKNIDNDKFGSYFLKTIMFKILEKEPAAYWENKKVVEVLQKIFQELATCFQQKKLTSFFTDDINLLEAIDDHKKLIVASSEAKAIAKFPLAFLPDDFELRLKLIEKTLLIGEGILRYIKGIKDYLQKNPFLRHLDLGI